MPEKTADVSAGDNYHLSSHGVTHVSFFAPRTAITAGANPRGLPPRGGTIERWPAHRNPSPLNARPRRKLTQK